MWKPPPPTETALLARAVAEEDRIRNPERYSLDPDAIAAAADRGDGDIDRFAPGWREGLEQYLGSARQDGRLNALGVSMVARTAIAGLRSGSDLRRYLDSHPEALCTSSAETALLDAPIIIVGGWRTGTTFLHRLLATDGQLRAPLPAELTSPTRIARLDPAGREALIERSADAHEVLHQLNPEMRAIHDSGARLAEECVLALGADLRNWAFTSNTRLDSYAAWLASQDISPGYAAYRTQLSILAGSDPAVVHDSDGLNPPAGSRGDHRRTEPRRWVLKAPAHLAELPALSRAFPAATIVWLQRDIVETVASGASLFATFRSTYSDEVDPTDVGRTQVDQTELWFRRAVEFRDRPESGAGVVTDTSGSTGTPPAEDPRHRSTARRVRLVEIPYERLIGDTAGVLSTVYGLAGIEPPDDVGGFIDRYHSAHPRGRHGTHKYEPGDFGLVPDAIRERFAFLDMGDDTTVR